MRLTFKTNFLSFCYLIPAAGCVQFLFGIKEHVKVKDYPVNKPFVYQNKIELNGEYYQR
jgi:hypothetical protein